MITKRVYIDLVDNNYDKKTSLAIGPWCFDNILDPIQILVMNIKFKNKTALVLSASKGIGFGIAKNLQDSGCDVIISSSSKKNLLKSIFLFIFNV